ncbi:helix-turn-helix domain-containing protein [Hymenobacter sp. BRD67]|uniref:helix-turn-helix domain-containing protein n=1 Tax=Hymenobacter sp. BRD67 TaxID=2675877 RepID=UPI0015678840|nr:helix-turn-helix domain-containing protein [Hymenobacter sp. BRD67]QKG53020.1 helix-turn-helix domain-containing protein [Hymenobacter sp. BRD67]
MDNSFEAIARRLDNLEALLVEILTHLRSSTSIPKIGGIELAQQITRLSKARLYALVSARQIPHAKRGNKLYFTQAELQAWVMNGKRSSPKQLVLSQGS